MRTPEDQIFSVRRRLRNFFQKNENCEKPFYDILLYIKQTHGKVIDKKRVIFGKDLQADQYFDNPNILEHVQEGIKGTKDTCNDLIKKFSTLMLQTAIVFPFVKHLEHYPSDAMAIIKPAMEWAKKNPDIPKMHFDPLMIQFVTEELLRHPELLHEEESFMRKKGSLLCPPSM